MLPFSLVQKLYAAGFPYAWITWEGKLWEDPDNQPGVGDLIRAMPMRLKYHPKLINDAHFFLTKLVGYEESYWAYYEGESGEGILEDLDFRNMPLKEVLANLWLALSNHVDIPTRQL